MSGEAGKGSGRRSGSDDKKFRKGYVSVKDFEQSKCIEEKFEEKFMGKTASEEEPVSGKYFME
jgi:DNA primase large subunit